MLEILFMSAQQTDLRIFLCSILTAD